MESLDPKSLFDAVKEGHVERVEDLLKVCRIWTCITDENRQGPLHHATTRGFSMIVESLLNHGFSNNTRDYEGYTPFHYACMHGHVNVINIFVTQFHYVIRAKREGGNALHFAAANGHVDSVTILLNRGMKQYIDDLDYENRSPLLRAVHSGNIDVVEALLQHGAFIHRHNYRNDENFYNERIRIVNELSPIYTASVYGFTEMVNLLLDSGADINDKSGKFDTTPLHVASDRGHLETVNLLLERGALVDEPDSIGYTPIFLACESGHIEVVQRLIEAGASFDNFRILHLAYFNNQTEIFKLLLLDNGVTINEKIYYKLQDYEYESACKEILVNHIKHLVYNGIDFELDEDETRTEIREMISISRTLSVTTLLQDNYGYFNVDTMGELVQSLLSNNI